MQLKNFLFLFLLVLAPVFSLQGVEKTGIVQQQEAPWGIKRILTEPVMAFCISTGVTVLLGECHPALILLGMPVSMGVYHLIYSKIASKGKKYNMPVVLCACAMGKVAGFCLMLYRVVNKPKSKWCKSYIGDCVLESNDDGKVIYFRTSDGYWRKCQNDDETFDENLINDYFKNGQRDSAATIQAIADDGSLIPLEKA